jgi:hypothetical protein
VCHGLVVKADDSQSRGCGFKPRHHVLDGMQAKLFSKVAKKGEAGVTFDNYFFDNYFDFLRQLKNGSFLGPVFVHVKVFLVEVRINRT